MPSSSRCYAGVAALLLAVVALGTVPAANADLLFFKDGFAISGTVKQARDFEIDPVSKEPYSVPSGAMFLVDGTGKDYCRRIVFSPTQVRIAEKRVDAPDEKIINKRDFMIFQPKKPPTILDVMEVTPWDEKWQRTYKIRHAAGVLTVPQQVAFLTPYSFRIDATKYYSWSEAHLTRELTAEQARDMLNNHPDFDERNQKEDAVVARRLKAYLFFAQAGWFDEAERELNRIEKDFPNRKEQLVNDHTTLNELRARDRLEQLKRRHLAGQFNTVRAGLANFPLKTAPARVRADVTTLQAEYNDAADKLDQINHFLDDLPQELTGDERDLFQPIAHEIKNELHPDRLPRLEPFLGQARQWKNQRKAGKTPDLKPSELLALATTGWLLGGPSAESKPERAAQLWQARALVLEYQKTLLRGARQQLLSSYMRRDKSIPLDEVMQLIPHCPPPEMEPLTTNPIYNLQVGVPSGAGAGAGGNVKGGASYLVQLPGEYHHGRAYPVLIVLHDAGEKARHQLDRWSEMASEHGYILVAPTWDAGAAPGGANYTYTPREHAAVVDTLRDLRRRFRVDSDRVFLFGLGQGGSMAFDVGLGHPDLFAGVMPMSAGPEYFSDRCWRNGQNLPFYVVSGDRTGEIATKELKSTFEHWVTRNYPMIWVNYRGRGPDFFSGELPNLFDWMRPKRRAFPLQQLGTNGFGQGMGNEFTSLRSTDNSFYWLTADISPSAVTNPPPAWNGSPHPATFVARVDAPSNIINLDISGARQVTLWFGRNSRGESIVDLAKPVTVNVNLMPKVANRKIEPSLEALLEDLFLRGDQQRLFPAKLDIVLTR